MTNGSEKYIETVKFFGRLYDYLNGEFFNEELIKPVITVSPDERAKATGWFVCKEVWQENGVDTGEVELNICANFLNRPLIDLAETMLHEMCHNYAYVNKIQDCSRSGTYHNKLFQRIAEMHGLIVEKVPTIGYARTSLADASKAVIEKFLSDEKVIFRLHNLKGAKIKGSSTRKYICPVCGMSVRATKKVNIICADCDEPMQEDND
jgi:hypothetical protein